MNKVSLNLVVFLVTIVVSYLFGAIPNGVIIGKLFFGKDPRDFYSKNSGGTNVGRVCGTKAGIITIILDMIKVLIPVYVVWAVLSFSSFGSKMIWENGYDPRPLLYWGAGFVGALGHCYPIYIGFKGGKAVASFMGYCGFTVWALIPIGIVSFFGMFIKKRIVSISSLFGGACLVLAVWVMAILSIWFKDAVNILTWSFGNQLGLTICFEQAIFVTLTYGLLVIRHKSNIERLKNGTEKQLKWSK